MEEISTMKNIGIDKPYEWQPHQVTIGIFQDSETMV